MTQTDVFTTFLSQGKHKKAVRDIITTLQSWQAAERIPAREWDKFQTASYKLRPTLKRVTPRVERGDFPSADLANDYKEMLYKKYNEDSIFDISLQKKWTAEEEQKWKELSPNLNQIPSGSETYGGFPIAYKIWKKLQNAGSLISSHNYLRITEPEEIFEIKEKVEIGLQILKDNGEKEGAKLYEENLAELNKIYPIAVAAKEFATKVESKKDENARIKKATLKGTVNPVIYEEVKKIAEEFRVIIEANQFAWFKKLAAQLTEKANAVNSWDMYVIFPVKEVPRMYGGRKYGTQDENEFDRNQRYDDVVNYKTVASAENNWAKIRIVEIKSDAELQAKAYKISVDEAQKFLFKMADKLGGLFKDIDVKLEVSKHFVSSIKSHRLLFMINNGESKFDIQNQITHNHSHLGNFFYRYPTTFHNAEVKGVKVKSPDEDTVKRALNAAYKN